MKTVEEIIRDNEKRKRMTAQREQQQEVYNDILSAGLPVISDMVNRLLYKLKAEIEIKDRNYEKP